LAIDRTVGSRVRSHRGRMRALLDRDGLPR